MNLALGAAELAEASLEHPPCPLAFISVTALMWKTLVLANENMGLFEFESLGGFPLQGVNCLEGDWRADRQSGCQHVRNEVSFYSFRGEIKKHLGPLQLEQ